MPSRFKAAPTSSVRKPSRTNERTLAFSASGSDEMEAGNTLHRFGGVEQKVVLVTSDVHHADAFEIVDSSTEADGIADAAGAGFESARGAFDTASFRR